MRGLCCLLLAAYHVVGVPGSGMQVEEQSIYRHATGSTELIRMPPFTCLSGPVYACRPMRADRVRPFLLKTLRRLRLPFPVASTLFYIAQTDAPGANGLETPGEVRLICLFLDAHFWYLQSLLILFAVITAPDLLRLPDGSHRVEPLLGQRGVRPVAPFPRGARGCTRCRTAGCSGRSGRSSCAIHLWHAFFTAAAWAVKHRVGAGDTAVFLSALAAGNAGPMVRETAASIWPLTGDTLVGKV